MRELVMVPGPRPALRLELERAAGPLRQFVEAFAAPLVLTDPALAIVSANDALCQLLGWAPGDLDGADLPDCLLTPDQRAAARHQWLNVTATHDAQWWAVSRAHQRLRLRVRVMALREGPRLQGFAFIASESGVRHDERYAWALEAADEGVWEWAPDGSGDTFYSERYWELLGYAPGEPHESSRSWETRLHPEDKERVRASMRESLEAERAFDEEFRLRVQSGAYRWFHARGGARRDHLGRLSRVAGALRDVTARKDQEHALRESHARLRGLVESAGDAIVSADGAHRVVVFNRAAERLFGLTAGEVLGASIHRLLPGALDAPHVPLRRLRACRADGTEFVAEATVSVTDATRAPLWTVILRCA